MATRIPRYRLHKPTGQGFVELNGRRIYLGAWGTPQGQERYHRVLAEWLANGRRLPVPQHDITITELIARFWEHAQQFYRGPGGEPTSEVESFRHVLRPLRELYGSLRAVEFGPRALKAVRQRMIDQGWVRTNINRQVGRLKMVFKWATSAELIPPAAYQALSTVAGLKRGRTEARESRRVRPVAQQLIDAVKPFVSRQVWALIQLQCLSGARPGELLPMRPIDLDTNQATWVYRPSDHKTAHFEHDRAIYFGPRAKEILGPFLVDRPVDRPLFSPAEAAVEQRARRHAARKTPMSCGNRPGSNCKRRPIRQPGAQYDVETYRRAIARACGRAFPLPPELEALDAKVRAWRTENRRNDSQITTPPLPPELAAHAAKVDSWKQTYHWHPHQLRHNAATLLRKEFGIEAARVVLGHKTAAVTEIYAELDQERAMGVMAKIG